jgi:hypothetical protein
VLKTYYENPDLIKLLLHYGVDHQVCCIYERVRSYINLLLYILIIYMTIR